MTREEAIKNIADSYNEAKADFEENEDCYSDKSFIDGVYQGVTSACFYINQIDEPKWHKVAEKGLPTEEGLYRVAFRFAQSEFIHETIANWVMGKFKANYMHYELPIVIAWQKITPFSDV